MTTGSPAANSAGRSRQKREAILEAALSEFEARGFSETSMDRIADTARVSKRTVYNHFASKEALFDAIVAALSDRVARVTDYRYEPDVPLDRQLRAIAGHVLDMLVAPCFVTLARVALVEMIRSPELARKTYNMVRERQAGLVRWLADAADDGRLRLDDPVWACDQFLGMLKTFAFWPQILGGQSVPDTTERARIVDTTVCMFVRHYSAE